MDAKPSFAKEPPSNLIRNNDFPRPMLLKASACRSGLLRTVAMTETDKSSHTFQGSWGARCPVAITAQQIILSSLLQMIAFRDMATCHINRVLEDEPDHKYYSISAFKYSGRRSVKVKSTCGQVLTEIGQVMTFVDYLVFPPQRPTDSPQPSVTVEFHLNPIHSMEKQEEEESEQLVHTGFWDKDPESTGARKAYLKIVTMGGMVASVAIWCVLTIYWGAFWQTLSLVHGIHGCVVDFDGGDVGLTVSQYIGGISGPDQLTWEVHPASMYPNGPSDLAEAIVQEKCWVGISINPGATTNLALATTESDATYNGSLAITAYTNEARNENAYGFLILPNVQGPIKTVVAQYAETYVKRLSTRQNIATILSQAPSIVTTPISFTVDNLRPFDIAVATAVDFVGLIYLLTSWYPCDARDRQSKKVKVNELLYI
ncbi:hypothetical protein FIBSPDRAFT_897902 [Athelia psychrophila]|uniref:DUF3533 domain-containing protein n=1 Tax=Athelia psychrophila TaxID=1759441 RepID=A0A166BLV8_9AGAM|nr:hypothetical protein FIBSPDRAFT_897902 [Fibularhizoctonia sp. CBS 109695]